MMSPARRWGAAFFAAWQADWRERLRDWRVGLVLGLGVCLAAAAALITATELRDTTRARAEARQAEQARWLNQGAKYPHSAAHYGVYVFKPLSPLAAVDPGVEHYVGASVWLEAHKQNEFLYRPANDAPGVVRQFSLSPAFVLQVLVPLAMVFLGFGVLAGERERGSLAALRISAAPLGAVALARGAVLCVLALLIAMPACLAVAWVQGVMQGAVGPQPLSDPFSDAGWRTLVFVAGYGVYIVLWALVVVGVSAAMPTLLRSLAVLMALWAVTTLVLPRAAVEWSQGAAALPSAQVFRQQLEAELGEPHDPAEERREQQALLAQHGVTDLKQLPVNWAGISLQRGEAHGNAIFDAHYGRLYQAMQRQSDAAARWGWLSPTVALAGLSAAAAASDTAHHVQFVRGAEAHRRLIQQLMNDEITAHPEREGARREAGADLWARVPPLRFVFEPLAPAGGLWRHAGPLLALLLLAALACALAVRRLKQGALK